MLNVNLFTGRRVRLSVINVDEAALIARWSEDAAYARGLNSRPARLMSTQEMRSMLEDELKAKDTFMFGIRRIEDDQLVGFVQLDGIAWNNGNGWLALGIGSAADRSNGYGGEALALLIDYAFRELNLHRVQLTVFSYNAPAIALYERLGFVREGTQREFLHRDGAFHDIYLYGLLRREWEAQQRAR